MKLGLMTAAFPGKNLKEVAEWASANGFEMLELACWPVGKATRRYAGVTTLDVMEFGKKEADEARRSCRRTTWKSPRWGITPIPCTPTRTPRSL